MLCNQQTYSQSLWLVCKQGNHSVVKTTNLFLQCTHTQASSPHPGLPQERPGTHMQASSPRPSPRGGLVLTVCACTKYHRLKTNCVQDGAATSCIRREISVSVATNGPFWQINLLPFCLAVSFGKMILLHLKSSILAEFCKLNHR